MTRTRWPAACHHTVVAPRATTGLSPSGAARKPKGFVAGSCRRAPTWARGSGSPRPWAGTWPQGQDLGPHVAETTLGGLHIGAAVGRRLTPRADGHPRTARRGLVHVRTPHGAAADRGRVMTSSSSRAPRTMGPLWDVFSPSEAALRGLMSLSPLCWVVGRGAVGQQAEDSPAAEDVGSPSPPPACRSRCSSPAPVQPVGGVRAAVMVINAFVPAHTHLVTSRDPTL